MDSLSTCLVWFLKKPRIHVLNVKLKVSQSGFNLDVVHSSCLTWKLDRWKGLISKQCHCIWDIFWDFSGLKSK